MSRSVIPLTHVYLAAPYTHRDARVRHARFIAVTAKAADLWRKGFGVYSPVTQTHEAATRHELPIDWAFWGQLCSDTLRRMHELHVLCLPGWEISTGVRAEIDLALSLGLPVVYSAPASPCFTCPYKINYAGPDSMPCGWDSCPYTNLLPADAVSAVAA